MWPAGALATTAGEGVGATVVGIGITLVGALVRWTVGFCMVALPGAIWAQPALTTISDTVYRADGTATSYDILVISSAGSPTPPYGTGNFAVAANVPQSSVCTNGVCSYTDTQAAPSSYTLPAYWLGAVSFWTPKLNVWPGGVILSPPANSDFNIANHPVLYTDLLSSSVPYISAAGGVFSQIFALHCATAPGSIGYVWPVCLGSYYPQTQMRLMGVPPQGGSGTLQNVKGVLNIGGMRRLPGRHT